MQHRFTDEAPTRLFRPAVSSLRPLAAAVSLGLALGTAPLQAQDTNTNLGSIGAERSSLLGATGDVVQGACGRMVAASQDPDERELLVGDTLKLFNRCGELVHNGNEVNETGGTEALSLGLNTADLQEALQKVAPEETEALGASLTDSSQDQLASLASRLEYLRTGTTTLPVAGIYWSGEDMVGGTAGDDDFSRLGAFITGVYGTGDKDETNRRNGVEDAYDFDAYGFTAGLDYRFGDSLILGIGLGYLESEVEFDGNYGENETEGLSFLGYGSWYSGNLFVEGSLVYSEYDYDMYRNVFYPNNGISNSGEAIEQRITSDTEGDSLAWNIGVGYNFNMDNINTSLSATLRGLDADIDGYAERGGELAMALTDQEIESLQTVLAAQASFAFNQDYGVFVPYVSIAWHHEFEDDPRDIYATYVFDPFVEEDGHTLKMSTDGLDDNYFNLGLGANFVLTQGTQIFVAYDTLLGLKEVSSHAFTVGARLAL